MPSLPLPRRPLSAQPRTALGLLMLAVLAACGGGNGGTPAPTVSPTASEGLRSITLSVQDDGPAAGAAVQAVPTFHVAPALLDDPEGNATQPHRHTLSTAQAGLATRGLSADDLRASRARAQAAGGTAKPQASSTTVVTYTPAQIRAAYGLPAVSGASAASLGAGQTIYIVDAKHDPNAAAELAAFNSKFGLPGCTTRTLTASTSLPLTAAGSSCELVLAYATTAGALTGTAPAYDSGWATEIALDVQWAHAIAPLARLVLIEAPDASGASLSNAVKLANSLGPGVVSMSFGAPEGSWVSSYDAAFSGTNMSYLAATGDNGAAVSWPAVSTKVLAVGGTNLTWGGAGSRSETAWSNTGGGVSAYVAAPSYQSGTAKRSVADVAFNANPYTGQYVATMAQGSTTVNWISAGGTSLSTPQWAGLLAVANALRAQAGKAALGQPHTALYNTIAKTSGPFADITSGSNGSCSGCTAKAGYDIPTGWGTPNGAAMLTALSGVEVSSGTTPAPTPTPTASLSISNTPISGVANKALSATIAFSLAGASSASISISGAPSGMSFSATSSAIVVNWAKPVAGSYTLRVSITDNLNRSASASVPVTISK